MLKFDTWPPEKGKVNFSKAFEKDHLENANNRWSEEASKELGREIGALLAANMGDEVTAGSVIDVAEDLAEQAVNLDGDSEFAFMYGVYYGARQEIGEAQILHNSPDR